MKKIILSLILAVFLMVGCTNEENDFQDYTAQAVYFPFQYPVRTLVLGETAVDNSIDLQHAFNIGVCVGGVYSNNQDRIVKIGLAPEYLTYLNDSQVTDPNSIVRKIKILPSDYYTLETTADSTIVIPKGSFNGIVKVKLKDAFFSDTATYRTLYVLPLKIKSSSTDILSGVPALSLEQNPYPNPFLISDWKTGFSPMNFTLFAVKYNNPWHGTYFYRGKQYKNEVLESTYHTLDQELNLTASVVTTGYKVALLKRMGTFATSKNIAKLTFSDDSNGIGDITISSADGSSYGVTGTGKFYKSSTDFAKDDSNAWLFNPVTGKKTPHLTMTLDYTVTGISLGNTYHFTDTLVMRDNSMVFQTFSPYQPQTLTGY